MPDRLPIIVATDGSDRALRILPHADCIATPLGAPLQLVQVLEQDDVAPEPGESLEEATQRTVARMEADMAADLRHFGVDGTPRVLVAPDGEEPATTLLRASSEGLMLAMHSRGRGSLARLLYGSVAMSVLRRAERPVLLGGPELLPPPVRRETYRIVLTSDLSPDSEQAVRALAPLLEPTDIKVTLLYVHFRAPAGIDNEAVRSAREAELKQVRTLLPASLDVDTVVREIPIGAGVDTAIMEEAVQVQANAIAMSTHGHSARHHLLMGSVAMSIVGRSRLPVIVVRARDQGRRA